jgi:hypothetical protein
MLSKVGSAFSRFSRKSTFGARRIRPVECRSTRSTNVVRMPVRSLLALGLLVSGCPGAPGAKAPAEPAEPGVYDFEDLAVPVDPAKSFEGASPLATDLRRMFHERSSQFDPCYEEGAKASESRPAFRVGVHIAVFPDGTKPRVTASGPAPESLRACVRAVIESWPMPARPDGKGYRVRRMIVLKAR